MYGPKPAGFWSKHGPHPHGHLSPGTRYRVARPFVDFDRVEHPVGEEWTFLGSSYLPYDDGLSLFVSFDGEQEWHVRLQVRDDQQGHIVRALEAYIVRVDP